MAESVVHQLHLSVHSEEVARRGLAHLRAADPVLRALIDSVGDFRLRPNRNRFQMLVRSIISQQVSTAAARSIRKKLERTLAPKRVSAEGLAATPIETLRGAGLSPQKAAYLHDLAARIASREVRLHRLSRMPDEAVIEELTRVKGIGRWTAQMFLIFSLGRPDVFPCDDLGIRMALRNLYRLKDLPDRKTSESIAAAWKPYATMASWYCWRSLD